MEKLFIGFDTSAYTTSIGVVDQFGNEVLNLREILKVKKGNRGLRQQEAVFQHINNLPKMIEELTTKIDIKNVEAISASGSPRNIIGSYMPVFKAGKGQAFILSSILEKRYFEFSHQEGHIGSYFINNKKINSNEFLALHISGGTTELLKVVKESNGLDIEIIGGSKDISAGQLIDRIGIKLGLNFPCGKEIDELSSTGERLDRNIPISTKETWINFSGTETYFQRLIDNMDYDNSNISKSLLYAVTKSIGNIISEGLEEYKIDNVLITGGVASNSYIRNNLANYIKNNSNIKIHFPNIEHCTDNGVGIAYLGSQEWIGGI
ncbi:MAG: O-sialoglycoprotein endopeptidase [Firmicutes bacterium]|nr:O-sialoglycoprotein endopeptidase [Bacillota bacterium]